MEWFKHFSVIRERHVTFLEEHETQETQLAVPENIVDVLFFLAFDTLHLFSLQK